MTELHPQDRRRVNHLVDGLWFDLFARYDADPDVSYDLAGKLASAAERAIITVLEDYYG